MALLAFFAFLNHYVVAAASAPNITTQVDPPPVDSPRAPSTAYNYPISGGEAVPDNACASNPLDKVVTISTDFTITDVNVGVNLTHSSRRHIVIKLIGPDGTSVVLHDGTLMGPYTDIDALFDQSALTEGSSDTAANNTALPHYDTQWNPAGNLDDFAGKESVGDWILRICDKQSTNIATFNNAELFFEGLTNALIPTTVRGTVFNDENHNGKLFNESGVENVTVTAYDAAGNVAGGGPVTTDSRGWFTVTGLTDTEMYRLEFSSLPAGYEPGPNGANSDSGVLFVTSPASKLKYGVYIPSTDRSCTTSSAQYVVTCFTNGDPTHASNTSDTAIAKFDWLASGSTAQAGTNGYINIAEMGVTGPVWGLAYDDNSGALYSSAVVKRHVGAGPNGIGAIYKQTDVTDRSTVSLFHDFGSDVGTVISNTGRFPGSGAAFGEEGPCATCDNIDANAFAWAGQRAFGDIDISADGQTLYVINLFDRQLYGINTAGTPAHTAVAGAPWLSNGDCNTNADTSASGVARPWAIKVQGTDIYVGVVCDASTSTTCNATASCADLTAHVYRYNGTAWSTAMASSALSYARDLYTSASGGGGASDVWHPWTDTYTDIGAYIETITDASYPQPILGDIEFAADGHMILSFLDRSSLQFGYRAPAPNDASSSTDIIYFSSGDILRATESGGIYTMQTTEYYDDQWSTDAGTPPLAGTNDDTTTGGVASSVDLATVLQGASDAIDSFSAGVTYFDSTSGNVTAAQEVFQSSSNGADQNFAKAGGLGDLELICYAGTPEIEIGNRVWCDGGSGTAVADNNGIQDPGEAGITGVTVRLTCGAEYAEMATDSNGNYLFTDTVWEASANTSSQLIPTSTACNVTIDTSGPSGTAIKNACSAPIASPTSADASSGLGDGNDDVRDSDGIGAAGGIITAVVNTSGSNTTGTVGQNDHRIDFGFAPGTACGANVNDIGGTIWRDFNANGINDSIEPGYGVTGMVVHAYADDNATPVATANVSNDGTYTFVGLANGTTRYRLEFSGWPSHLQPGASGAQNGTNVQFVTDATCQLDLGLNDPSDYCQSNPEMATTCFVSGDPLAAGADMTNDDALVRLSYSVSGVGTPGEDEFLVSTVGEIGAAWGMAYDRINDRLFVSEIVKRHVGLIGAETGGVIYQITNPSTASAAASTYLDFVTDLAIDVVDTSGSYAAMPSNSTRGLQAAKADQSVDLQGFQLAAKASFGDMDISHDGETLYVVNLGDRRVYAIDISQVDSGTKNATALPAFPDPGCTLGVARPWALEIHDGLVYLGVVCSAESGGSAANLSAHVYAYDPSNNTWNTTSLIDMPLNYTKGLAYYDEAASNRWNPWTDDFSDFTIQGGAGIFAPMLHPQPILADIEFDHENSMHLAFADRAGHQFGHRNVAPTGGNQGTGITGGDLIRTYYIQSTGLYTYEINASVGPYTSTGANNNEGRCDDSGNCGEFYFDDYVATVSQPAGYHQEIHSSGLAHIRGTTLLPAITMDPMTNRLDAQGLHWYDITTGAAVRDYEVFRSTGSDATQFSKSNGLGDLELLCQAAPLEIGNYVWLDADADGVQDPSEAPLVGVKLQLWLDPDGIPGNGDDRLISTTQTNTDGEYYFGAQPNSRYYVAIEPNQTTLSGLSLTGADYSANSGNTDAHDSDGILNSATRKIVASVTTGGAGQNDYSYDFGFTPLGVIGNYVWLDENSDGYQDAGEPGIPNVTVILRDATNTPILTTTTDANGGYLFTDLPVGTYSVDIIDSSIPTGMSQTTVYTNGTGDFGNKDHSGNGYSVTIGNGNPLENLTADFGYNYNPTTDVDDPSGSPTAALGDRVWYDTDADGVQDPEEVGIYNVCLELFTAGADGLFGTADDASQGTTTTDYNGNYIFDGLMPGAYTVQVCSASLTGVLSGLSQTGDPDHFGSAETGAHYEDDHRTTSPVVLGPGDVFLNVDFGYDGGSVGSIGDTVFYDYDADGNGPLLNPIDDSGAVTQGAGGTSDAADSGIAGVTISLIRDLDGDGVWETGEPIIATTVTNANGQYLFAGLPLDDGGGDSDADYIIWVNDTDNVLNGLAQTYDSDGVLASPNLSAVALSSGTPNDRNQDFGYSPSSPLGSIGDTIWNDVNGNGTSTPDDGEPGIANVGIKLFADADANGIADDINGDGIVNDSDAIMTTVTDENGHYLFERLPFDNYLVEVFDETLPSGFNTTPTYDPDGTTPINIGSTVTLTEASPVNHDQDFGYTYTDPDLGSIGDQLWGDLDNGGESSPEAGDPPLAGVVVYLTSSSGYSATAVTDENGYYLFNNLPIGTYTVTVDAGTIPDGFSATPTYDPQGGTDGVSTLTLAAGEHNRDQDFAYPPTGLSYTIGDTVWFDVDNSGGDQSGQGAEPGIADVLVLLYNSSGTLVDSVRTDANGHYLFTGLLTDTYTITIDTATLPPHVSIVSTYAGSDGSPNDGQTTVAVNTANPHGRGEDFSYPPATALGTIGDTVWFDINGDGDSTPDAGEPGIEGVVVVLTDEDGNTWTTLTDENGNYTFGNLPLGKTYTVTIPASNFATGGVLEGMSNTYDPDNDDDNAGVGITLTNSNPVNLDQDFSYTGGVGQLGNLVWLDANADGDDDSGTAGSGEGPIANVTLVLYRDLDCNGVVDAGEPLFGNTATVGTVNAGSYGANGVYDFDGLPITGAGAGGGSCWVVDVTDQNNILAGYWHSLGTQGTDNHSQADPYGNSGTGQLELTAGSPTNLTADFGYYVDPAAVGNFVWFDLDYDGVQDSGEFGLDGITVTLVITYPSGTNVTLRTLTGDDPTTTGTTEQGWYSFGNLLYDEDYAASTGTMTASGSPARPAFVLSIERPLGYMATIPNASAATDQNDADLETGVAAAATVGSETTVQNSDPTAESTPIASYDFGLTRIELGDLPDGSYKTLLSNSGAQHVVWPDYNNDHVPDVAGSIWAGTYVDVETDGHQGGDDGETTGDDTDGIDDEDGLIVPPQEVLVVGNTVTFSVTLRSRGVQTADYGLWIDWDSNGDFNGTNEFLSNNGVVINTPLGDNIYQTFFTFDVEVPAGTAVHPNWIYVRGRVFAHSSTRDVAIGQHSGLASNGEVEDFATRLLSPTAVGLSSAETASSAPTVMLLTMLLLLTATGLFIQQKRWASQKRP